MVPSIDAPPRDQCWLTDSWCHLRHSMAWTWWLVSRCLPVERAPPPKLILVVTPLRLRVWSWGPRIQFPRAPCSPTRLRRYLRSRSQDSSCRRVEGRNSTSVRGVSRALADTGSSAQGKLVDRQLVSLVAHYGMDMMTGVSLPPSGEGSSTKADPGCNSSAPTGTELRAQDPVPQSSMQSHPTSALPAVAISG